MAGFEGSMIAVYIVLAHTLMLQMMRRRIVTAGGIRALPAARRLVKSWPARGDFMEIFPGVRS